MGTKITPITAYQDTEQSTGSASADASCTTAALADGVEYLVIYGGNFGGSSATNEPGLALRFGGYTGTKIAEGNGEGNGAGAHWTSGVCNGVVKVVGDGSSTLAFSFGLYAGTGTAYTGAMSIIAIPLTDLVEGTDYWYYGTTGETLEVTDASLTWETLRTSANAGVNENLSIAATADASHDAGVGYTPDLANDDDWTTTRWAAGGSVTDPTWLEMDFGSQKTFDSITFKEAQYDRIDGYQCQYYDGTTWYDITGASGTTVGANVTVTHNFNPVSGTKCRIYMDGHAAGPSIWEFAVYGPDGSGWTLPVNGDYLVIMNAEGQPSDAGAIANAAKIRYYIDSTEFCPTETGVGQLEEWEDNDDWMPFAGMGMENLSAGATTFKIECASRGTAEANYRRSNIAVINCSSFKQVVQTRETTGESTASTTKQAFDGMDTTFTPTDNNYIVHLAYSVAGCSGNYITNFQFYNDTDSEIQREDSAAFNNDNGFDANRDLVPTVISHAEQYSTAKDWQIYWAPRYATGCIGRNRANDGGIQSNYVFWELELVDTGAAMLLGCNT